MLSRIRRDLSHFLAAAGLLAAMPLASRASILTFYSSRSSFNSAEPGLPVESFSPNLEPAVISAPLSSTTNNGDFAPGNILPGITIDAANVPKQLYVLDGYVSPYYFEDPLLLDFAPGVSAVAADFFASSGTLQSWAGTFTADVFSGSTRLGSQTFAEVAFGKGFLGVSSTTPITRIEVTFEPTTDLDWAPYVDNVAFGPQAAPTSVPEPTTRELASIAAVLVGLCVAARRRT